MRCKNYLEATTQAIANANKNNEFWCVFSDTSGNWNCEVYRGQTLRSGGGVSYERVTPGTLYTRFIPRMNSEMECWEVLDLLEMTSQGDDAEPTVLMAVYDDAYVQPAINWLNSSYVMKLLP